MNTATYTFTTVRIGDIVKPTCRVERATVQAFIDFVKSGGTGEAMVLRLNDNGQLEPLEDPETVLAVLLASEESGYDAINAYVVRCTEEKAEAIRQELGKLPQRSFGVRCIGDGQHCFRGLELRPSEK